MNSSSLGNDRALRRILAFFLLIAVILVVVAIEAARNISRSVASSDWVNHTHAVILEVDGLRSALLVCDGALHTYVLTDDARDQVACREALANVEEHLELTKALTRLEPEQHAQVMQLGGLADQRAIFVRAVLAARQAANLPAVQAFLAADAGRSAIQEIQAKIQRLKGTELALLAERDTASYLQAQATRWTVWTGVILDVLLLGGVVWLVRDDMASRSRAAAALREVNNQLEDQVLARTAELVATNTKLVGENLERQWSIHALEHQLRYNQLIVNSVSDLVFVLTKVLNISRVNPAVIHMTGWEPAELINQPLSRIVRLAEPIRTGDHLFDPIAQALNDGRDLRNLPAILEDRNGRTTQVRFALFPLRDRDKVVGGVVTIQVEPSGLSATTTPLQMPPLEPRKQ